MGVIDKIKSMVSKNSDKAKQGVDKATTFVDEKTGGKHSDKIDQAKSKANDFIDDNRSDSDVGQGEPGNQESTNQGDEGRTER